MPYEQGIENDQPPSDLVVELGRWQSACLFKETQRVEAEGRARIAEYKLSQAIEVLKEIPHMNGPQEYGHDMSTADKATALLDEWEIKYDG